MKKEVVNKNNNFNKADFGKFIANLRNNKGLTQTELADRIGASFQAVSKWENNKGFPDVIYQSKICEIFDISLEELHNGELNLSKRRKSKFQKMVNIFSIIFASIFIPVFICLSVYFFTTYNSIHIYSLYNKDTSNTSNIEISGIYVTSKKTNIIYIGNINLFYEKWNDKTSISVDLYYNGKIIYHANDNKNLLIKLDKKLKIDLNKVLVKVSATDEHFVIKEYISYLDYLEEYTYDYNISKISNKKTLKLQKDIIDSLIDLGFIKNAGGDYIKEGNDYSAYYYVESNKLSIVVKSDSITKSINYKIQDNVIDVSIFQDDEVYTMIEKYSYDYDTNKINCTFGPCNTVENVLNIMEKYTTIFFVE